METKQGIPVHHIPAAVALAEAESKMREYERRYEMSSEKMATLMELDAIRPTAEVLRWYSTFQGAKLLRETTTRLELLGPLPDNPRKPSKRTSLRSQ